VSATVRDGLKLRYRSVIMTVKWFTDLIVSQTKASTKGRRNSTEQNKTAF